MLTRAELGIDSSDFAVLAVGDITVNKNHRVLVEAMAILPRYFKLFIAGDGPQRGELKSLASRLGISDRVTLLGFRNDIPALLNACDLFCFPSKREGLPVSLLEAMATGTPVMSSDARGCADVLGDSARTLVSRNCSPEVWAQGIASCALSKSAVDTSFSSRKLDFFSIQSTKTKLASIYRSI